MRYTNKPTSHYTIILQELVRHGGSITYEALLEKYEARGYNFQGFIEATGKLKQEGIVTKQRKHGAPIVATGACPCCGQDLDRTAVAAAIRAGLTAKGGYKQ
jgi:hypothetical protein